MNVQIFVCAVLFFFYLWLDFIGEVVLLCSSVGWSVHKKNGECSDEQLNEQFGVASQIYIEFRYDLLLFDDENAPLNAARFSL